MGRLEFDRERELAELREYLGPRYDEARLRRSREAVDEELAELGDEAALYRTSEMYLYDLTAFAMSATKLPYLDQLTALVPAGARVLDYGCGIGSDGLMLLEAGYDVGFADFDNPSTRYLRWRLERRGLEAPVYDLDTGGPPAGWDAAYAFDVIEHVDDPFGFLARIEGLARIVVVNFLEPHPQEEPDAHRPLPIQGLLRHAAARRLRRYRVHHGRSHLVAYEQGQGGIASRAQLLKGRFRARFHGE
jgi:2-polyprenyl-3-methyl-5-hydroxy-6-metoxy-1,4-benzoquinol methylase